MARKISVLTFGWEFPPHISGGLGTACHGLTRSLIKQGTGVVFVVPKAYGDEDIRLVDASEVFIPLAGHQVIEAGFLPEVKPSVSAVSATGVLEVIRVTSAIQPYTSPEAFPATRLQQWNYVIRERHASTGHGAGAPGREIRYHFTGAYGPHLLEEVARYAEVGGAIGGERRFDVIHAHDWLTFPAGIAAKKSSGRPLIVHVHATEFDRAGNNNVDNRVFSIEKEGLCQADRVVAVSDWTKHILMSKYGVAEERISVVHNGVTQHRAAARQKPLRLGRHTVTFLGRITHQKGPQYFVEAARKVLEKFPDTHFVMAGSGDLLPIMMERVASLKLSSRFHFTGFLRRHQVDRLWELSDVYVMPSVSEPFGITPLEAIQSGVPVIVSNQSGVAEVMPHAIKTDFWNTEALAGSICSVLGHKSLSRTLRKNSRETLKGITWDTAARKLNKIYHELASESR